MRITGNRLRFQQKRIWRVEKQAVLAWKEDAEKLPVIACERRV